MSISTLITETFSQSFSKYLYNELVVGKLAHTKFKNGINKGDKVNVVMPGAATISPYAGGDLNDAEEVNNSVVQVAIDKGAQVHFIIPEEKIFEINNAPDVNQKVKIAAEYSSDAAKQFAAEIDTSYANLYTRAGISYASTATTVTEDNIKKIFTAMARKFKRGDNKGHTSWKNGKMLAIIPPEIEELLANSSLGVAVESTQTEGRKGVVRKIGGWDILTSNNIASPADDTFACLFGIEGETLAGGASKTIKLIDYIPDKRVDQAFKGTGYHGEGAPRADYFGVALLAV